MSDHKYRGFGALIALMLLAVVELSFHTDSFLYRLRSVFAAGRTLDKVLYVESKSPSIIILGNSRIDNGIVPPILQTELSLPAKAVFNLGIPGANLETFHGVLKRVLTKNSKRIPKTVILGLDESIFHHEDDLGYQVFFSDKAALIAENQFTGILANTVRLWGYSANLKQLKKPEKLTQFMDAIINNPPPWGGSAEENLGFRTSSSGMFQREDQLLSQELTAFKPPEKSQIRYLERIINLLNDKGIKLIIVFPPLLNREMLFFENDNNASAAYRHILFSVQQREIPIINLSRHPKHLRDFADIGHLNSLGSVRYSQLLAHHLKNCCANDLQ